MSCDPPTTTDSSARALVLSTLAEHGASLLTTARLHSLCPDDAQDAYQRAVEVFLKRAHAVQPHGAAAWLRTVIKHEALAIRASRLELVSPTEGDLDQEEGRELAGAEERACSLDHLARSAEALARCKPAQVRALVLRAHGYSYREIASITGWTQTKVNRAITEGRREFRQRFADIETGRECERWSPLVAAAADGEATAHDLSLLRPHLRRCAGCRAALRRRHEQRAAIAALVPLAALEGALERLDSAPGALVRLYEAVAGSLHERTAASAQKLQGGLEAAASGKAAAVAASATALAGGGVAAVSHPVDHRRDAGSDRGRVAHKAERRAKKPDAKRRRVLRWAIATRPPAPAGPSARPAQATGESRERPRGEAKRPARPRGRPEEFAPVPYRQATTAAQPTASTSAAGPASTAPLPATGSSSPGQSTNEFGP